jgi:hypothetical protein
LKKNLHFEKEFALRHIAFEKEFAFAKILVRRNRKRICTHANNLKKNLQFPFLNLH